MKPSPRKKLQLPRARYVDDCTLVFLTFAVFYANIEPLVVGFIGCRLRAQKPSLRLPRRLPPKPTHLMPQLPRPKLRRPKRQKLLPLAR